MEFKLAQFSGPLDVLLALLDEQQLSISEVSLSAVTEQYLQYVDQREETNPDDLADFLVVATRLLLMKARMLLPQFLPEEDDETNLAEQLRLYKAFMQASKKLNEAWISPLRSMFRIEPPRTVEGFVAPANLSLDDLKKSMVQLINRLTPPKPLPETRIDKTISMKEKIDQIRALLRKAKHHTFHSLLHNQHNKTEMIVSFLALLELVKQRTVSLQQEGNFSDIMIHASS